MERGEWVLLDEINLASMEALTCVHAVIDACHSSTRRLALPHADEPITIAPTFRLFAAMNPADGDVGKAALAPSLRRRFTEIYVGEMSATEDLRSVVNTYLRKSFDMLPEHESRAITESIVKAHLHLKQHAQQLTASTQPPLYRCIQSFLVVRDVNSKHCFL